jgi:hypothetical protein
VRGRDLRVLDEVVWGPQGENGVVYGQGDNDPPDEPPFTVRWGDQYGNLDEADVQLDAEYAVFREAPVTGLSADQVQAILEAAADGVRRLEDVVCTGNAEEVAEADAKIAVLTEALDDLVALHLPEDPADVTV